MVLPLTGTAVESRRDGERVNGLGTRENPRVARRSHRLPTLRHSTNVLLYWIGHGTVRNEGVLGQRVVPSGGFS